MGARRTEKGAATRLISPLLFGGIPNWTPLGGLGVPWSDTAFTLEGMLDCGAPWLSMAPDAGNVAPEGSQAVTVNFDPTGLELGTYEASLCIASSDPETPILAIPVTLTVEGVPDLEPPVFQNLPYEFEVDELADEGASVGMVTATDPNDLTVSYSLLADGNTDGAFAIDAVTGELTVANPLALNLLNSPFALTVRATNEVLLTSDAAVSVTVLPVDGVSPYFDPEAYAFAVVELAAVDTLVGMVSASDPQGQLLSYAIASGDPLNPFKIDALTGDISVEMSEEITLGNSPFVLTVTATNQDGYMAVTSQVTVTVMVTVVLEDAIFSDGFESPPDP